MGIEKPYEPSPEEIKKAEREKEKEKSIEEDQRVAYNEYLRLYDAYENETYKAYRSGDKSGGVGNAENILRRKEVDDAYDKYLKLYEFYKNIRRRDHKEIDGEHHLPLLKKSYSG